MKTILSIGILSLFMTSSYAISSIKRLYTSLIQKKEFRDIPLMPGLKPLGKGEDIGQEGEIFQIETEASGNIFIEDIEQFYKDYLVNRGWERTGRFSYILNDKVLDIFPQDNGGMLTVIFQVRMLNY